MTVCKGFTAVHVETDEGSFIVVNPQMLLKITFGCEHLLTVVFTAVESVTSVKSFMSLESVESVEGELTFNIFTYKRFLLGVDSHVGSQSIGGEE